MNKNKTYIFCLMLTVCAVCQAQKLDIRPYILYHQSISPQELPVFYTTYAYVGVPAIFFNRDFTLATGMEYGLAVDYTLRNQLGLELGLGYFSGCIPFIKQKKDEINPFASNWNYHSIAVRPLITYGVIYRKSTFIGKIGPTIHYASASLSLSSKEEKVFANSLNLGYSIVFEYDCQLSKRLSLAMELGLEHYKYTPSSA